MRSTTWVDAECVAASLDREAVDRHVCFIASVIGPYQTSRAAQAEEVVPSTVRFLGKWVSRAHVLMMCAVGAGPLCDPA
jgi:hypothetical protein